MDVFTLIQTAEFLTDMESDLRQYEVSCQDQTVNFTGIESVYKLIEIMDKREDYCMRRIYATVVLVRTDTAPFIVILKPFEQHTIEEIRNYKGEVRRVRDNDVIWRLLHPTLNAPQRAINKMVRLIREHMETKWYRGLKEGNTYVMYGQ